VNSVAVGDEAMRVLRGAGMVGAYARTAPWLDAFGCPHGTDLSVFSIDTIGPVLGLTGPTRGRLLRPIDAEACDLFDPPAAADLGALVARWLTDLPDRWALRLEQVPADSAVVAPLAKAGVSLTVEGDAVPMTRFDEGERRLDRYTGKGFRKQARQALRWLERTSGHARLERVTGEDCAALLPAIDVVRRSRDVDQNRLGSLSSGRADGQWNAAIAELAREGRAEAAVLWAGNEVAAYNLVVHDPNVLHVLDGRIASAWSGRSVGRIVDGAAVQWALDDPACRGVDWGRGITDAKQRLANDQIATVHLLAASDRRTALAAHGPWLARRSLARVRRRHPGVDRVWLPVKHTLARGSA
jgi:hypothetical protein